MIVSSVTEIFTWDANLEQSDHETVRHQFRITLDPVLKQRENAPSKVQARYEQVHGDFGKEESERYLAQDSPENVDGLQMYELIAVESQLLLQAGNVGVILNRDVSGSAKDTSGVRLLMLDWSMYLTQ